MKRKIISSLILSIFFVVALSTLAFADNMDMSSGTSKMVDGINVKLSFKSDRVKTGNNDIMITLMDGNNQPITNAMVSATAAMNQNMNMDMSSSSPLKIAFQNGDEQGQYMGAVNFTDKGNWIVNTVLNIKGQEKKVQFNVNVTSAGPNWYIIGGFLGVIALIIIVAAINKKKTANA